MYRAGIILDTDEQPKNGERRARWYALAAQLGLLTLGPRVPPTRAGLPVALPCPEQAERGKVVPIRRKA
jgi:hypothetical protein